MIAKEIVHKRLIGVKLSRFCLSKEALPSIVTDDSLVFLKASSRNCERLLSILDSFCEASGMFVNYSKSGIFFLANLEDDSRNFFSLYLRIPQLN